MERVILIVPQRMVRSKRDHSFQVPRRRPGCINVSFIILISISSVRCSRKLKEDPRDSVLSA